MFTATPPPYAGNMPAEVGCRFTVEPMLLQMAQGRLASIAANISHKDAGRRRRPFICARGPGALADALPRLDDAAEACHASSPHELTRGRRSEICNFRGQQELVFRQRERPYASSPTSSDSQPGPLMAACLSRFSRLGQAFSALG